MVLVVGFCFSVSVHEEDEEAQKSWAEITAEDIPEPSEKPGAFPLRGNKTMKALWVRRPSSAQSRHTNHI
eukprot:3335750-Amphidinium_carterae.1